MTLPASFSPATNAPRACCCAIVFDTPAASVGHPNVLAPVSPKVVVVDATGGGLAITRFKWPLFSDKLPSVDAVVPRTATVLVELLTKPFPAAFPSRVKARDAQSSG